METIAQEKRVVVTVFPRGEKSHGKPVTVTLVQLHDFLTVGSNAKTKEDLGGWSPARYRRNHRKLEHLVEVYCAVLDIDNAAGKKDGVELRVPDADVVTIPKMLEVSGDVDTFIYTSFRNKPEWPKFRVVMPFDRPLNGIEYPKFWSVFSGVLKAQGIITDPQAKDGCRLWYLGSKHAPHFEVQYKPGKEIVVEDYLSMYIEPAKPVRIVSTNTTVGHDNKIERARRYVAKCPPAVAGDGGHKRTWSVCCSVVRGFDLDDQEAMNVMTEWNNTCDPPWSDRDLMHKITEARSKGTTPEIGAFLQSNNNRVSRLVLTPEEINIIQKARKS